MSQTTRVIGVITVAATTVERRNVRMGSPLTLTSTFHVPWIAAAANARPIARAVIRANGQAHPAQNCQRENAGR